MGLYRSSYSISGASVEYAVLALLDLPGERATAPGVDDLMGSIFMRDRGDGVGQRVRPTITVTIRCKVSTFAKSDEQMMDQTGNDPDSSLFLTLYEEDLIAQGLLVNGVHKLKPGDRLLQLLNSDGIQAPDGTTRMDFAHDGRPGLRCLELRPGITGTRTVLMIFESQRESATGLGT